MASNRTLGRTLAYLEFEEKKEAFLEDFILAEHELECLAMLKEHLNRIKQRKNISDFIPAIPENSCNSELNFLHENPDFFLTLLFFQNKMKNINDRCERISNHLNSCYRCFEDFSQVMRNYYYKHQELFNSQSE